MAERLTIHREALEEYADAIRYYARKASERVATDFTVAVESGLKEVIEGPAQWPPIGKGGHRARRLRRFPYYMVYRYDQRRNWITIFAIAHKSRGKDYWSARTKS